MRILFLISAVVLLFYSPILAEESERKKIVMAEDHERNAMSTIESALKCCDNRDLDGFLECFTKSVKPRVRRSVKNFFSEENFCIKVVSSDLISINDKFAKVNIRYKRSVDQYSSVSIESTIVLTLEDDSWLIHSEKVSNIKYNPYVSIVGPKSSGCVPCRKRDPGIQNDPGGCADGMCIIR